MAKILIVDDDFLSARNLQQTYQLYGYEVYTEQSFADAAERIISGMYDVIVCDTNLGRGPPELLGYQLLDYARSKGVNVPFVGVSGNDDYRSEWKRRGAGFVEKGSGPSSLYFEAVKEILGQ